MGRQHYIHEPDGLQTVSEVPGHLVSVDCFNGTAAPAFLQFYDVALADDVDHGTTVPFFVIGVPSGGSWAHEYVGKKHFSRGCIVAATTTSGGSTTPTYTSVEFDLTLDFEHAQ